MGVMYKGEELETGEEDFLLEPVYDDDICPILAERENITLTDDHWLVIRWLREKYKTDGHTPNFRNMIKELDEEHPGHDWKKKLYELFPNQPARQGPRIAGLTKPYGKGGY